MRVGQADGIALHSRRPALVEEFCIIHNLKEQYGEDEDQC
jgi:hypothetical protein